MGYARCNTIKGSKVLQRAQFLGLFLVVYSSFSVAMQVTLALLIVIASIYAVDAFSGGAPVQACDTLSPNPANHGADPQDSDVPYSIDLSVFDDGTGSYFYTPGNTYTCEKSVVYKSVNIIVLA